MFHDQPHEPMTPDERLMAAGVFCLFLAGTIAATNGERLAAVVLYLLSVGALLVARTFIAQR